MNVGVDQVVHIVNVCACLALLIRLGTLKLHRVYRVFSGFLVLDLAAWVYLYADLLSRDAFHLTLDYQVFWIVVRIAAWALYVWMVYDLLEAILKNLPGILTWSRRFVLWAFAVASALSLLSINSEYRVIGIKGLVGMGLVIERTVCTIVLLVLLAVLGFLIKFPVEIPRNLAYFSVGFLLYFGVNTVLDLTHSYFSHDSYSILNTAAIFLESACFLFWTVMLSSRGEAVPIRMGSQLRASDRERLLTQLDAINAALLRSAARR
jgi:hypothetical protein